MQLQQVQAKLGGTALLALAIMLILATEDWGEAHIIAVIIGWVLLVVMAVFA